MRLWSDYREGLRLSLTVDSLQVKLVAACPVCGFALLPSAPPVELVGEYISGDAVTFMGVFRSPFSELL